jgi:ABC-type phosphate transport system substrate-binding protein
MSTVLLLLLLIITPIAYSLPLASTDIEANLATFIWSDFIQLESTNATDNQNRVKVEGVGSIITTTLMEDALFMFNFANDEYYNMVFRPVGNGGPTLCRLQGYLQHCLHPFVEYGGNAANKDANHPVFVDYAVDDLVPPPQTYEDTPDLKLYPIAVTGVVPVVNIPGISRLIVTKAVLARIMRGCDEIANPTTCEPGSIRTWNHPDILALNPNSTHSYLAAAGSIKIIIFGGNSGITGSLKAGLVASQDIGFKQQFKSQINSYYDICSAQWPGVDIYDRAPNGFGTATKVLNTVGAISYLLYPIYLSLRPLAITLIADPSRPTTLLDISTEAIGRAVDTVGNDYGNNGDDPKRHTISLGSVSSADAWPFSTYHYVSLRSETTRIGPQYCNIANATLSFLTFFYTDERLLHHLPTIGWVPAQDKIRAEMIQALRDDLKCQPLLDNSITTTTTTTADITSNITSFTQVYKAPYPTPKIRIIASASIQDLLKLHFNTYQAMLQTTVDFEFAIANTAEQIVHTWQNPATDFGQLVFADENLSLDISINALQTPLINVAYGGMGMVFAYRFCQYGVSCPYSDVNLIVSITVAAKILDGKITWWNDTEITDLNPGFDLPPERIYVLSGPQDNEMHYSFLNKIRRCCDATFTYQGPEDRDVNMKIAHTYQQQRGLMYATPYSFGYMPLNSTLSDNLVKYARVINRVGNPIYPNTQTIEACALDTFDTSGREFTFNVDVSQQDDCYPLTYVMHIITKQQYLNSTLGCYTDLSGHTQGYAFETAQFLNYLLAGEQVIQPTEDRNVAIYFDLVVPPINNNNDGTMVDILQHIVKPDVDSIICSDVQSPSNVKSLVRVPHVLNLIPKPLIYFVYVVYFLFMCSFIALMVWILIHRNRKLIRNSSPAFMLQVLFGAAIQITTSIPLSQQDDKLVTDRAVPEETLRAMDTYKLDIACASEPILFTVGFFIMYSALFLKAWRLIRIFNNTKLRHLYVRDAQLFAYQAAVVVFVVGLNLTWVLTDPLHWKRNVKLISERFQGLVIESAGLCQCNTAASAVPLLLGVLGVLIFGNYLAYLGRHIPTEFNESKWTAMAMVVNLEAILLGLPILVLANDNPTTGYVIKVFILMLMACATVGLVFLPKLALAYGWFSAEGDGSDVWRFAHSGSSGSNNNNNNNNNNNVISPSVGVHANNKDKKKSVNVNIVNTNNNNKKSSKTLLSGTNNGNGNNTNTNQVNTSGKVPSLASLVDSNFTIAPSSSIHLTAANFQAGGNNKVFGNSPNPSLVTSVSTTPNSHSNGHNNSSGSGSKTNTAAALVQVLEEDPLRRRFRRFLATIKAEESVRFWDSVEAFQKDPEIKRASSARAIIQYFIQDSAPKQINLKATTRAKLLQALTDASKLTDITLFDGAIGEVFEDLKQSDAFSKYLAGGGATNLDLGVDSDVSLS